MSNIVNMRVGFYILILSMKNNLKKYIILMLVLILFLLPIMQVLSNIEALKGGKAGLIVLGIICLFSIIYWIIMIILVRKGDKK